MGKNTQKYVILYLFYFFNAGIPDLVFDPTWNPDRETGKNHALNKPDRFMINTG